MAEKIPNWRRQGIPSLLASDEDVRGWMDRHINPVSPRRRWQCQRAALNLWMYLGRQWIEPRAELAPGNGTYHFKEIYRNSNVSFPRPVTNIIAPSVDNEVARLSRKEYLPDTSAGKHEPEWMAAARLAKDIVKWEMSKQMWDSKREQATFILCTDGIVGLRTWWDENDVEVTLVAAPDQRRCPACGSLFASAKVPATFASIGLPTPAGPVPMQQTATLVEVESEGEGATPMVEMRMCPLCPAPTSLEEYEISEEEALQQDAFGRPMGLLVPRGEGMIDVVSLHEFFPENSGIGLEPHECRLHQQMTVRPLEWIALRFPEISEKLTPEEPQTLLRVHPLYSEPALAGMNAYGQTSSPGFEIYSNHAAMKELIVQPQPHIPGLELGAHFIEVCGQIVRRDLCVEVEGEDGVHLVPRMKYHFARFKRIPKMFHGRTFVDDLVPLQRRLNELDAQVMDLRERGKPNMWVPQGTEIRVREDSEGGSLEVIEYDASMSGWDPSTGIFPGAPMTGNAYMTERQQIMEDAKLLGSPQDIEMGSSPGSVKTTSGLMLLSEEASQKRGPRERGLVGMYESAFEHILELNYAFRKEEQAYEILNESGVYERKSYTGTDLLGTIKVKMSARPGYDETLYNKEATTEAIQMGLYKLDTPAAVDRALDNMRLPKDVNEKQTLQISRAEMAWSDFMRSRRIPVIDPTMHDPLAWYSILTQRWLSDEAYALQREAKWDELLPAMANWEQRKLEIEAEDALQKQIYGNVPPEQWAAKYAEGQALREQAMAAMQAVQSIQPPPPTPGMPPLEPPPQMAPPPEIPPPPLQGFLPEQLELRIYAIWRRMIPELTAGLLAIEAAQGLKAPIDSKTKALKTLDDLLKLRAVIEAFRLMMTGAAMPPPPPGAPTMGAPPPGPAPAGPPAGPPPPGAPGA